MLQAVGDGLRGEDLGDVELSSARGLGKHLLRLLPQVGVDAFEEVLEQQRQLSTCRVDALRCS